jgi:hypothetical protein
LRDLASAAESGARSPERAPLEITVTPTGALDRDVVKQYEDLGVDRLVPIASGRSADALIEWVSRTAEAALA